MVKKSNQFESGNRERTPSKMITDLEIPDHVKLLLERLLNEYGESWHQEVDDSEESTWEINPELIDPISGLANKELPKKNQKIINEMLRNAARLYIGYETFLENISELIEQIEDDESIAESTQTEYLLREWRDERIYYWKEIKKMSGLQAKNLTYLEIERIDLGGKQSACYHCGVIFYDNLFYINRHRGIQQFYCSVDCESKTEFNCVVCGNDYVVGLPHASLHDEMRILRLGSICSSECLNIYKTEEKRETRYVDAAKRRALKWKVEYDESITRKTVFERGDGICYLCKMPTHLEHRGEGYEPEFATVDHKVPISKGGSHTWENVANCCLKCNLIKHDTVY